MKKFLVIIIIASYIGGCASPTPIPTATPLPSFTSSPLPTSTATPSPTETPTPTQTPIPVKDLDPIYTESIIQEIMGVQITTKIITDETLSRSNPRITEISINPNFWNNNDEKAEVAIAHFMASTIFNVWWRKGETEHRIKPSEDDFKSFMELWSLAQKGNDPNLWRKVQFTVFANDLNTYGYTQEKTVIWPMYMGNQAPDDVRAIKEINIALVRGPRMENITLFADLGQYYGEGVGVNLDKDNLFIYVGVPYGYSNPANTGNIIASELTCIPLFLIRNRGKAIEGANLDDDTLRDILIRGRSRTAIKVYPPSDNERRYNP